MSKKSSKSVRVKSQRGAASITRSAGPLTTKPATGTRGTRGAAAGANQGGAPRGASRLEPSTLRKGTGRVSGKRGTQKSRGRVARG